MASMERLTIKIDPTVKKSFYAICKSKNVNPSAVLREQIGLWLQFEATVMVEHRKEQEEKKKRERREKARAAEAARAGGGGEIKTREPTPILHGAFGTSVNP